MVYEIDSLDVTTLIGSVAAASASLARLDERLARSSVRDGWIERQHFADACAALWLEGELVHGEDLVLHDAQMDIRMPTHALTRAQEVLRTRRQIFGHKPDWALSTQGLRSLARRDVGGEGAIVGADVATSKGEEVETAVDNDLAKAIAALDLVLARSAKVLDGQHGFAQVERGRAGAQDLVYDPDWDEAQRLSDWRKVLAQSEGLPVILRMAIALDAWAKIDVLQRTPWLGPLLVGALGRQHGLAAHHLPSLHVGAKNVPRERRRAKDRGQRLLALIQAMDEAAQFGLKEHDRLLQAKGQVERRLSTKRKNSSLPDLAVFVLSRPIITAPLVAKELRVSLQGALNLIKELGLREVTGRGRYRAWGIV